MSRAQERKDRVREMLDAKGAVHPTGKDRSGKGTVAQNPVTVNPGGVVETYLGPAGGSTPLEALLHQAETVADLFDRLGRDTSDVELAHDLIESLVRIRRREAQLEVALRKVYDLADHAPVAGKAERVIADIQHACKAVGVGPAKQRSAGRRGTAS
jgi:hypothetical protein